MNLTPETKANIYKAHTVRDILPDEYLTNYSNIYELLRFRLNFQPDDIYIVYYDDIGERVSLTYSNFISKVFKTANLLQANGIKPGNRIATVSHNHINTVIQYFAAWTIGATVVPVNVNEETDRIKYILNSSETKLAFIKEEYLDLIKNIESETNSLKKIILHGTKFSSEKYIIFEKEIEKYSDKLMIEGVNQETEALIVYTSGTTGMPKGVVLTQYNLLIDADGISKWHKLTNGQTMMCVLPIHHVNGTVVTLMTPMYYGGRVILNQKFHTNLFFKRLADENVQIVSVVPTLLQFLAHEYDSGMETKRVYEDKKEKILNTFRHIICGAGPLTCELASKFENTFGLKIVHGYGLSETTCYSCFLPIELTNEEHKSWMNEFGFPSIGVEIEPNEMDIQDPSGNTLNDGERGEIVIRGHNVMKFYDDNPEANDKAFEFGWFRSGDEGFYKTDTIGRKFFFITGRIKELIIRGGINIAPLEIDEVLMSIPEVKAGIAVGFDNDWYGEEVGALVQLKENILTNENSESIKRMIIEKCRNKLPAYKTPKVVIFSDTIPVTTTGKYQRNKVKHLFSDYKGEQFKSH